MWVQHIKPKDMIFDCHRERNTYITLMARRTLVHLRPLSGFLLEVSWSDDPSSPPLGSILLSPPLKKHMDDEDGENRISTLDCRKLAPLNRKTL